MKQSWTGRIVGTIIGLLFFNPLSALIGFAIGWYFVDRKRNMAQRQQQEASQAFSYRSPGSNVDVIQSTFAIMGYVARGAGRINESHVERAEMFMLQMRMDERGRQEAIHAFNRGKESGFNLRAEVEQLRRAANGNSMIFAYVFEIVVQIALADGRLEQGEYDRLLEAGNLMGFDKSEIDRVIKIRFAEMQFEQVYRRASQGGFGSGGYSSGGYSSGSSGSSGGYSSGGYSSGGSQQGQQRQGQQSGWQGWQGGGYGSSEPPQAESELQHAYDILGVESTASFEEIKKAHRRLMLKYHPDRLASQGLPPEMVELYTQKAQDIQAAFDLIKKARGEK